MDNQLIRRQFLALVSAAMGSLAGCVPEGDSVTVLGIETVSVSEMNGTYTIETVPEVGGNRTPFQNVSLIGLNEDGTEICRTSIGDLTRLGEYDPVRLRCEKIPHSITYDIERDPCGQDTNVQKMVYDSAQDDWVPQDINCV